VHAVERGDEIRRIEERRVKRDARQTESANSTHLSPSLSLFLSLSLRFARVPRLCLSVPRACLLAGWWACAPRPFRPSSDRRVEHSRHDRRLHDLREYVARQLQRADRRCGGARGHVRLARVGRGDVRGAQQRLVALLRLALQSDVLQRRDGGVDRDLRAATAEVRRTRRADTDEEEAQARSSAEHRSAHTGGGRRTHRDRHSISERPQSSARARMQGRVDALGSLETAAAVLRCGCALPFPPSSRTSSVTPCMS
jgi:hypothetical protein